MDPMKSCIRQSLSPTTLTSPSICGYIRHSSGNRSVLSQTCFSIVCSTIVTSTFFASYQLSLLWRALSYRTLRPFTAKGLNNMTIYFNSRRKALWASCAAFAWCVALFNCGYTLLDVFIGSYDWYSQGNIGDTPRRLSSKCWVLFVELW